MPTTFHKFENIGNKDTTEKDVSQLLDIPFLDTNIPLGATWIVNAEEQEVVMKHKEKITQKWIK
jgi:hypothetical protein